MCDEGLAESPIEYVIFPPFVLTPQRLKIVQNLVVNRDSLSLLGYPLQGKSWLLAILAHACGPKSKMSRRDPVTGRSIPTLLSELGLNERMDIPSGAVLINGKKVAHEMQILTSVEPFVERIYESLRDVFSTATLPKHPDDLIHLASKAPFLRNILLLIDDFDCLLAEWLKIDSSAVRQARELLEGLNLHHTVVSYSEVAYNQPKDGGLGMDDATLNGYLSGRFFPSDDEEGARLFIRTYAPPSEVAKLEVLLPQRASLETAQAIMWGHCHAELTRAGESVE